MGRTLLGLGCSFLLLLVGLPARAQELEPDATDEPTPTDTSTEEDEEGGEVPEGSTDSGEGIEQELKTIEDLLDLIDTWDGGADELQTTYDGLNPELRAMVDENFESWALEGGIGIGGGFDQQLGDGGEDRPVFSTNLSVGVAWPMGDYALPVYYAVPDIPGPWAIGFNVSARTDNFNTFGGALSLHWAYEYIGTTPFIDIGPSVRWRDELGVGGRASVGYGNILLQGYIESDYTMGDNNALTVVGGVRIPWLLFTLI